MSIYPQILITKITRKSNYIMGNLAVSVEIILSVSSVITIRTLNMFFQCHLLLFQSLVDLCRLQNPLRNHLATQKCHLINCLEFHGYFFTSEDTFSSIKLHYSHRDPVKTALSFDNRLKSSLDMGIFKMKELMIILC